MVTARSCNGLNSNLTASEKIALPASTLASFFPEKVMYRADFRSMSQESMALAINIDLTRSGSSPYSFDSCILNVLPPTDILPVLSTPR